MSEEILQEISPEQKEVNDEVERLKNRLVEMAKQLYSEGFKVYALDSAADIFKSCMKIQLSKSKNWEEYLKAREENEDALYNKLSNELVYEEASSEENKTLDNPESV